MRELTLNININVCNQFDTHGKENNQTINLKHKKLESDQKIWKKSQS